MKKHSSPSTPPSSPATPTSATPVPPALRPSHDEIAGRARQLWSDYGQPSGRDEEIWLEAERQLIAPGDRAKIDETAQQLAPKSSGGSPRRDTGRR